MGVDRVGISTEFVARTTRDDHVTIAIKRLPQIRDIDLHGMCRRPRWVLSPHQVNESISGDNVVGVEKKDGENRSLFRGTKLDRNPVFQDLERTEDPELHDAFLRFLSRQ